MPAFLAFAGSRCPSWVGVTPVAWAVKIGYCVWLGHFTLPFGIALPAWLGLIAARVHYEEEEMVLEGTFPEYAEYRRQVGRFGPRLFSASTAREKPAQPGARHFENQRRASFPADRRNRFK